MATCSCAAKIILLSHSLRSRQLMDRFLLLSLSLRSRQFVDRFLLLSLSLRSRQLVDRFLLLSLSLRSRQLVDRFLLFSLLLRSRQLMDRFLLLSLSLRSRQLMDRSPFLASLFARLFYFELKWHPITLGWGQVTSDDLENHFFLIPDTKSFILVLYLSKLKNLSISTLYDPKYPHSGSDIVWWARKPFVL